MAAPLAGAAAAGGIGPAQPVTCLYRDYFSDAANDPFRGNYLQFLNQYGVPLANHNVLSPAEVQQLALSGQTQRVPWVFLLQLQDGKLHIFLQLARFDTRMGLPATPWDNTLYVQKGQIFPDCPMSQESGSSLVNTHFLPTTLSTTKKAEMTKKSWLWWQEPQLSLLHPGKTSHNTQRLDQFLHYTITHPDAHIRYKASDMHLWIHTTDLSYLNEPKARSYDG